MSKTDDCGLNPLHVLAKNDGSKEEDDVEIAKLIIKTCKQEPSNSSTSKDVTLPWLKGDDEKYTPLDHAIDKGKQCFAMYLISADENALSKCFLPPLLTAIEKNSLKVAQYILDKVHEKGFTKLLSNKDRLNALHIAPYCKGPFVEQVLAKYPNLLEKKDKDGNTVLHKWVEIGEVPPFDYIFDTVNSDQKRKYIVKKLISSFNHKSDSLIHSLATTDHNEDIKLKIAKIIVNAYKKEHKDNWSGQSLDAPWFKKNSNNYDAVQLAIENKNDELGLYILKQHAVVSEVLDKSEKKHETLFLAMNKNCYKIAEYILDNLNKESWSDYLVDSSNDQNVLHLVPPCKEENFGKKLINKASQFINQADKSGITPVDEGCKVGATWMIKVILDIDPDLALTKAPLAWLKACKGDHISIINTLISDHGSEFRNHCIKHKDTPLHHLKLRKLEDYENLLKTPSMKALINVQNVDGETPLHKAIQSDNIVLTEALLAMGNSLVYNLKNNKDKTAVDILVEKCREHPEWDEMCKRIGFDPWIKTTYFERKTNLLDVRNSLMVVAALLATITFTAGFTLPGGLNQDGEAMFAKNAAFLVFLLSDTVAMCFSMLVLVCLVWSMVHESSKSLVLIDRSMILLILSLYFTLLAFMTGVYVVISPKSLWVAIIIIVFCSIMGITAKRTLLYKVLFISSKDEKQNQTGVMQNLKQLLLNRKRHKDLEKQD